MLFSQELYNSSIISKIRDKYGEFTTNRFIVLKKKIQEAQGKSDIEKINIINDFFNKVKYAPDITVWKEKEYWATPYEFLIKDKGDSEDFVFAKYFTLVNNLGMDPSKFYFTYVKSTKKKSFHMVLTYYKTKGSMPIIIDSLNYKALKASKRTDIKPIYSFNVKKVSLKQKDKFKAKQGLKFKDLLNRLKREKI